MRRMNTTRPKTGFMSRSVHAEPDNAQIENHVAKTVFSHSALFSWNGTWAESIIARSVHSVPDGQKWFPRFTANESLRRTGLHLSLSAKSSF
jgi:hypothetical protein